MQENASSIQAVANELGITLRENNDAANRLLLAEAINNLVQNNFDKLVSILYRVDVSENKLDALLSRYQGTDAGLIIADLMIERQQQKIKSREEFRQKEEDIDEDERW